MMNFIPKLTTSLKANGEIYTVRRYTYVTSSKTNIPGVEGTYRRDFIIEVKCKEDLIPYVHKSGFDTIDAWWAMILMFIPLSSAKYMYHVVKVQ